MLLRRDEPLNIRHSSCEYCGLPFSGKGYSSGNDQRFCCYGCYLVCEIVQSKHEEGLAAWVLLRLGIAGFLAMNVMMLSMILYTTPEEQIGHSTVNSLRWCMLILSAPVLIILGGSFLRRSISDLKRFKVGMDTLVLTGSIAAFAISVKSTMAGRGNIYYDTSTMLLVVMTLGKFLEASAKTKTAAAISAVMDWIPKFARILLDGKEIEISSSEIKVDDIMLIRPGESIPADGVLVSGTSEVSESMLTGEIKPRLCSVGDAVYGGSINHNGLLTVRVTEVGDLSFLGQVRAMVQSAQADRAPIERVADRILLVFTPIVWITALSAGLYWGLTQGNVERAILSAIAVLVVACPCAFGLATPLAASLAIGKAARSGILVRSAEILERIGSIRTVVFDKTGTLTEGSPTISEIRTISAEIHPNELIAWAASLEQHSNHAVATAIISEAKERRIVLGSTTTFTSLPGKGVKGTVSFNGTSRRVTVGSADYLSPTHTLPDILARTDIIDTRMSAYVGWDGVVQGRILLNDQIRPDSVKAISILKSLGVRTILVSGDEEQSVGDVAHKCRIDEFFSQHTPSEKADFIYKMAERNDGFIAMVGDGINDAPALARAHIGIAVGSGTDLARQTSDVIIMHDDLTSIPKLMQLSIQTCRIIRQNFCWAIGYNVIAMCIAFSGFLHPLIAAIIMLISSLTVIANSLRIERQISL